MDLTPETIGAILATVGSAIGFTDIAKRLARLAGDVSLSPMVKRAIAIVAASVVAGMTGLDVQDILPGGAATDGAIFGILGTAIAGLLGGKKKPE